MLVLILVTAVAVVAASSQSDLVDRVTVVNGSYVLDKDNFELVLKNDDKFIVFVYVDWCGHCQAFKPTWATIAEQLNNDPDTETNVYSARVEDNPTIHNDWDTTSFPTIFYVRKGERKRFTEERSEENVLDFVKLNEQDPVIKIDEEDLEDAIQSSEVVVVGRFNLEDTSLMFEKIAWKMEISSFYQIEGGSENEQQIAVYSQYEGMPKKRLITNLTDADSVKTQIARYRRPYVIPFTRTNHRIVFEVKDRTVSVILFHDQDEDYDERMRQFGLAARVYSYGYNFVEMKMSTEYVKSFTTWFGVKRSDVPIIYIVDTAEGKGKISTTKDLSESGIAQLLEDYTTGTTTTFQPNTSGEPAEELPEDWDKRVLKYLTGENYLSTVLSPTKDVLVMWYKTTCAHCKSMESIWLELAERYKEHPTLLVGHIKSSNLAGVPDMALEKVPTILLYKRSAAKLSEAIEWKGKERTLKSLDEFLFDNIFNDKDEL